MLVKKINVKRVVFVLFFLGGFEAIWGLVNELIKSAGKVNIFPFSLTQIVFSSVWLLLVGVIFFLVFALFRNHNWVSNKWQQIVENKKKRSLLIWLFSQSSLISLTLIVFKSVPMLEKFSGYIIRISPFLFWILLFSLESIFAIIIIYWSYSNRTKFVFSVQEIKFSALAFFAFCLIWLFISVSGIGTFNDFGGGARPPTVTISYAQILIALLITFEFALIKTLAHILLNSNHYQKFSKIFNILIFITIWVSAVILWNNEPLTKAWFEIGPYPPKGDFYPIEDSFRFDFPAQVALIGNGLNNHQYIDNPFYVFFVMLLRLLAGQEYNKVILIQIGVLAFFPLILYEIGRILHRPYAGLFAAFLIILREASSIPFSFERWVPSVKILVTEPFITLLLGLFTLFVIRWLMDKSENPWNLMFAGGFLGLSTLVRANPWFLLPLTVLLILFKTRFQIKKTITTSFWFCLVMLVSIAPWMVRSQQTINSPFYMWFKYQHSVIEEYYGYNPDPQLLPTQTTTQTITSTPTLQLTPTVMVNQATPLPLPSVSNNISPTLVVQQNANPSVIPLNPYLTVPFTRIELISDNFMFNFINCIQILPTLLPNSSPGSQYFEPSSVFKKMKEAPFLTNLSGNMSLLVLLICVAIGMGSRWKRFGYASVFLLLFFLTYSAGTAIALTSGFRYTKPIEWVVVLFFSLGCLQILSVIARPYLQVIGATDDEKLETNFEEMGVISKTHYRPWYYLFPIILFLFIGSLIPLSDVLFPEIYHTTSRAALLSRIDTNKISSLVSNQVDFNEYLQRPSTLVYEGRIIYALYLNPGDTDHILPYNPEQNLTRINFLLIGTNKPYVQITLPNEKPWPENYLNGKTAIVIGCKTNETFDAMALVIPDENYYLGRSSTMKQECQ